jgi:hypothetical protein
MTPTVLESAKNKGDVLTDIDADQGFHSVSYAGLTRVSIPLLKEALFRTRWIAWSSPAMTSCSELAGDLS